MHHIRSILAASVAGALACGTALADEKVKTTDGREVLLRSDGTFKILSGGPAKPELGYRAMSITDFKLDKKDLVGQKIEVTGSLALFGGMATLSDPDQPFDTSPVIVSIEELPRADREFMLQSRCTPGCRVTVRGEVAMIMFQPGLNIEALVR